MPFPSQDPARGNAAVRGMARAPKKIFGRRVVSRHRPPDRRRRGLTRYDQLGTTRAIDGDGNGSVRCDVGAIEAPTLVLGDGLFSDSYEVGSK